MPYYTPVRSGYASSPYAAATSPYTAYPGQNAVQISGQGNTTYQPAGSSSRKSTQVIVPGVTQRSAPTSTSKPTTNTTLQQTYRDAFYGYLKDSTNLPADIRNHLLIFSDGDFQSGGKGVNLLTQAEKDSGKGIATYMAANPAKWPNFGQDGKNELFAEFDASGTKLSGGTQSFQNSGLVMAGAAVGGIAWNAF